MHNIAMALRAAYLAMHRQTNFYLLKHGVTADQFVCLVILNENDGITQQEIVKLATSDPNTIRAMLVLLEKQGLVSRDKHPHDGRAWKVSLTQKGKLLFDQLYDEIEPVRSKMLALFDFKEMNDLHDYLSRIANELYK